MDSEVAQLREALLHLSWPAAQQEQWFRAEQMWPSLHELALDFDAAPTTDSREDGEIAGLLREIARPFDAMSADSASWDAEALHRPDWEEIRNFARDALTAIGAGLAVSSR